MSLVLRQLLQEKLLIIPIIPDFTSDVEPNVNNLPLSSCLRTVGVAELIFIEEHRYSLPKEPRFYKEQMSKLLTPSALKNKCNTKMVHSERLGLSYYDVTIRKYKDLPSNSKATERPYYKAYSRLEFDVTPTTTPRRNNPTVFKQLQHLPRRPRAVGPPNGLHTAARTAEYSKARKREKIGSDVLKSAIRPRNLYLPYHLVLLVTHAYSISKRTTTSAYLTTSEKDQAIINAPEVYFRRTPPPDDASNITTSDVSYTSAAETMA
ncbi:hypothetical protein RhiirB3_450630 [Rhizophagus irregularis]|nr:hypothetical protein RhiirB3_450630 [Rhizophagus irregularis]